MLLEYRQTVRIYYCLAAIRQSRFPETCQLYQFFLITDGLCFGPNFLSFVFQEGCKEETSKKKSSIRDEEKQIQVKVKVKVQEELVIR